MRSLGSVYTPATSSNVTEGYLENLQAIARDSGKNLAGSASEWAAIDFCIDVFRNESPRPAARNGACVWQQYAYDENFKTLPKRIHWQSHLFNPRSPDAIVAKTMSLNIPTSALNPEGIQWVVIKHVVRTSDSMSYSHISFHLKAFSGRISRPSHEPDLYSWREIVDFLLNAQSLSDLHKTGNILDSLLPPASDVFKHISPYSLPS